MIQSPRHFLGYRIVFVIAMLLSMCTAQIAHAQNVNHKKVFAKGNVAFERGEFADALVEYQKLSNDIPPGTIDENILNYRMGMCYYNHPTDRERAIGHYEAYLAKTDSIREAHYFLAKTYHYFHQFDDAIDQYNTFRRHVEGDEESDEELIHSVITSINREVERCNHGKILIRNPIDVIIDNLGSDVNTEYSEYAPVIDTDEAMLVFTQRSPETTGGRVSPDGDWFEDIQMCDIIEGSLFSEAQDTSKRAGYKSIVTNFKSTMPTSISGEVNTQTHEGGIQFSFDGSKLFIYRDFNVWVTALTKDGWQKPKELGNLEAVINSKAYEPSISISPAGDAIYISSDRPGGFGGLDIYKTVLNRDGEWEAPTNLGPSINTRMDEDGPYIDPDGKTLYFSSTGHSSMGGYDVFKSVFRGVDWSTPQNLGYPLNSAGDDIFFMMTPRYNRAYYSSNKFGGFGKMDIYRLTFANERPPLAEIRGLVLKDDELVPTESTLTIYDMEHQDPLYSQASDSATGDYTLLFGHGKTYQLEVQTEGFAPYRKMFRIPPQAYYYQYYQEIHHVYLTNDKGEIIGQKVVIHNAYFDIDSLMNEANDLPRGSKTEAYQEFLSTQDSEALEDQLRYAELVDVKFYIPEDSLKVMMQNDSDLFVRFDIPQNADVGFLNPKDGITAEDIVSGRVPPSELKKITNFEPAKELFTPIGDQRNIVLTEAVTADSLEARLGDMSSSNPPPATIDPETGEPTPTPATPAVGEDVPNIMVLFDFDRHNVKNEYQTKLDGFIKYLKRKPDIEFNIVGHTDAKGTNSYNMALARQRAMEVFQYMTRKGISPNRLDIMAMGESAPIAMNASQDGSDNPPGRQLNRRVEFRPKTQAYVKPNVDDPTAGRDEGGDAALPGDKFMVLTEDVDPAKLSERFANVTPETAPRVIVFFDFDRSNVKSEFRKKLTVFAEFMALNPQLKFRVEGHTDHMGPDLYNDYLSQNRAEMVVKFMETKSIGRERLGPQGKSEHHPLAPNSLNDGRDNPDGRALNRRVEFHLVAALDDASSGEPTTADGANPFEDIKPAVARKPKGLPEFLSDDAYSDYVKDLNVLVLSDDVSKDDLRDRLVEARSGGREFPTIIVFFDFDKTDIKAEFDAKLGRYMEFMQEFADLRFVIEGHTDAMGSNRYNDGLSLRRSQQVIDYLVRENIVANRLEKSGKGEVEPMAPNTYSDGRDNPQGRALNRRVEFHIINPE